MRKKATEIVVGVVLLNPGRGRERTQPTRGSARYSHFTEPQMAAKHGLDQLQCGANFLSHNLTYSLNKPPKRLSITQICTCTANLMIDQRGIKCHD